jgi:hypothetical protein
VDDDVEACAADVMFPDIRIGAEETTRAGRLVRQPQGLDFRGMVAAPAAE